MSSINFNVKIGNNTSDVKGLSTFKIDAEMHKDKIEAFNKQMQNKLSRKELPNVFFELPSHIVKEHIPIIKDIQQDSQKIKYSVIVNQKKTFHLLDIIDPQMAQKKGILKKIQKVFADLTSLNNNFYLHGFIYGSQQLQTKLRQFKDYPICALLANCFIEGKLDLDKKFYDLFCQLTKKVSPKFADSPIMGLIPLFQDFDFGVELQSLADLNQQNLRKFSIFGQYRFPQNMPDPQMIKQLIKSNQQMNIYIWFGKLGYLKISVQMRLIGHWMCIR